MSLGPSGRCPSRQGWIRKKLFEAPHRVEIFLSKTYPSLLVYDVCGAGHSQMLLRYARPLRAVGASCRAAGWI